MRYEIDLTGLDSREELHRRLREALPLPAWYGNNLDALHDALGEMPAPLELVFRNADGAAEDMRDYVRALRRLGVDLMLERPREITVRWFGPRKDPFLARVAELRNDTSRHYNCAQSTLIPFAESVGMDAETAFRVAANFGAGMKRASVCGAITGGLMALGLLGIDDGPTVAEFHRRLREAHGGYLDCADLLRVNKERGGDRKAHCDGMVSECAALVEELARRAGKIH